MCRCHPNWMKLEDPRIYGTSLVVQWLRLHASGVGGTSLIPGQGTKIPHATWRGWKKKILELVSRTNSFPAWHANHHCFHSFYSYQKPSPWLDLPKYIHDNLIKMLYECSRLWTSKSYIYSASPMSSAYIISRDYQTYVSDSLEILWIKHLGCNVFNCARTKAQDTFHFCLYLWSQSNF